MSQSHLTALPSTATKYCQTNCYALLGRIICAPPRRAFISRNYVVSIVSRSRKKLDAAVEELTALAKELGHTARVFSMVADVGDCSQVGRSKTQSLANLHHCPLPATMAGCLRMWMLCWSKQ